MWHTKPPEDIFEELRADKTSGLSFADAKERLGTYGSNVLPRGKRLTPVTTLLRQFRSPLVYILLIAALLTAFFKEWVDMTVILLAVAVNVSVGFWQEFRSSNILKKLREVVTVRALVIREGEIHEIDAADVVPGDILVLRSGMRVPADARVIAAKHLEANEALLTGESAPVEKHPGVMEEEREKESAVGDRFNMVHMGTVAARGEGRAVAVAVGARTEIGKISLLATKAEDEPTPLQRRIGRLGNFLAYIFGATTVFIFGVGVLVDLPPVEMFKTAVAVAVAAIPEGLPAAISIVLAVSAQKILRRKGVVKHLLAAETLGSASVICADKTGTLTEGKMKVEREIFYGDREHARMNLALANEALVEKIEGGLAVRGELTDQAKMRAFLDAGGDIEDTLARFPRVSLLPFDSARKYLASLHRKPHCGGAILFVSGAPEVLLLRSAAIADGNSFVPLTGARREEIAAAYEEFAEKGYRVIAVAEREFDENFDKHSDGDLEEEEVREELIRDLAFVGIVAIRDPIRADVPNSIRIAREAGVRPIMVTGDHFLTARAIGGELGLRTDGTAVVEGSELAGMSDEELSRRIDEIEIFARVNPEHKMRIIKTLQRKGHSVSMTGDGINDAPALKAADIGVAVDSGTDVSKEASDLILLDNSFSVIIEAIKRGRTAFDNIKKVTVFLLIDSFTEVLLISSALVVRVFVAEFPLPITALQILWVNLLEDSLPNVALAFEPDEKDVMKRKPIGKKEPILDRESFALIFVAGIGVNFLLVGLFLFLYFYSDFSLDRIRTFVFATVGTNSFFYVYSVKSFRRSLFASNPFNNHYLTAATAVGLGLMLIAVYLPFMNKVLSTVPLSLPDWGVIVTFSLLQVAAIEAVKWRFVRRRQAMPRRGPVRRRAM